MRIMSAHKAYRKANENSSVLFDSLLKKIAERIDDAVHRGDFYIKSVIESSDMQDKLFDCLTEKGYTVTFGPLPDHQAGFKPNSARSITISWEDIGNE